MKRYRYEREIKMTPRYGQKFGTVYYRQTDQQKHLLTNFIAGVVKDIEQDITEHNNFDEWNEPIDKFKRTGKTPNYSAYQIVMDAHNQMQAGKDITKGLEGRWNKLFAGMEYEFDITQG